MFMTTIEVQTKLRERDSAISYSMVVWLCKLPVGLHILRRIVA